MIRDLENEDSNTNKNLEEYDNKVSIDKASSTEITTQEATEDVDDSTLISDVQTEEMQKRNEIHEQYNQSHQLTEERIRYQDFKQRNMEEFTNDYSISQVVPSGWTTFFNIISTILFTIAIVIFACIMGCFIFNVQIGIVPTDSMEPTIARGSLIFYRPIAENDINLKTVQNGQNTENPILCYTVNGVKYVHRLYTIKTITNTDQKLYVMVGDNPNLRDKDTQNPIASHTIRYSQIQGQLLFSVQNLGGVVYFVRNNFVLTISIFLVLIFGTMLARSIIEQNHAREEINVFIDKKAELEKQNEAKLLELQKEATKRDFDQILQTDYGKTAEHSTEDTIGNKSDFVDIKDDE